MFIIRILDEKNDKSLKNILLILNRDEMEELLDSISEILNRNKLDLHSHINDFDFSHEITITMYDEKNIDSFNNRCKKLILEDI